MIAASTADSSVEALAVVTAVLPEPEPSLVTSVDPCTRMLVPLPPAGVEVVLVVNLSSALVAPAMNV